MKTEIVKVVYNESTVNRDEENAYRIIQDGLPSIIEDLNEKTKGEINEYDLTNLSTICTLLGFNVHNSHNSLYTYVRDNWENLQSIGCTKTKTSGNYKLSFRGILQILIVFDYKRRPARDVKTEIEEVVMQENITPTEQRHQELIDLTDDNIDYSAIPPLDAPCYKLTIDELITAKKLLLSNKYDELLEEYHFRGEQLSKLDVAIKSLDLLADVDNFIVW